jgi:hypothetical protein
MRGVLSSLIEVAGALAVVAGAWLFDWRAGLVVLGLVLILAGWAIDSPGSPEPVE